MLKPWTQQRDAEHVWNMRPESDGWIIGDSPQNVKDQATDGARDEKQPTKSK